MPNLIGQDLGRYRVLEIAGEGGMSIVYKALDERLQRFVAIKIIRAEAFSSSTAENFLKRFDREAKTLAQLSHPNILNILDYGQYERAPYFVTEFAAGGTLKSRLNGKPMPYPEVIALLLPVIGALGYAHDRGIIHRDIKPSNILLTEDGIPKLSDFGIAKLISSSAQEDEAITATGAVVGTPEYMAPELVLGGSVDQTTDIYALGIILYEMLTGRKPYVADTPLQIIYKAANEPLPQPSLFVSLPKVLENILLKALAKNQAERFQSALELARALENFTQSKKDSLGEVNATVQPYEVKESWLTRLLTRIKRLFSRSKSVPIDLNDHWKTINEWKESGTMTVNMIAMLEPQRQKNLLTLINRDHELRIKDILVHFGGGRYLLHGFGRFGASALIDQIVEQARTDLKSLSLEKQQGIIMMVRVELGEVDEGDKVFRAMIRDFRFEAERGKYAKSIAKQLEKLQRNNFTKVSDSTVENTISIKATPIPGLETSFSRKADKTVSPITDITSETGIIDAISQLLDRSEGKKTNVLEKLMEKVANTANVPSRVIIVLDKIDSEKVFRILQNMRLFSDERITFFAVVREEEFLRWDASVLQVINKIGFREHYVPCVWDEEHHLARDMIILSLNADHVSEKSVEDFVNHIVYKSRGAPGDIVRELIDPAYNTYEKGVPRLSLNSIRDKKLIKFNAWQQKFLVKHWDEILGNDFLTTRDRDRAKIGVYELLEQMNQQVEFRIDNMRNVLTNLRVTPSYSQALQGEIVQRLVSCMVKDGLLTSREQDAYRINFDPKVEN